MKLYELYIVFKPSLSESEVEKSVSETIGFLAEKGFGVTGSKTKINEHLPYPIKHFNQGHLADVELSGPDEASFPSEIDSQLRHNENILRHLILAKSEKMLKKMKPLPSFETRYQRPERKSDSTPSIEKAEPVKMDTAEVDKKLEEILK